MLNLARLFRKEILKAIPCGAKSNYWKICTTGEFGLFDFKSIMLYRSGIYFDGQGIDVLRDKEGNPMPDNRTLSQGDIDGIKQLYK